LPSTYSPSLRIELIGAGEQSGTWGTTTNTNLGTLLEQSIAGVQAITMSNANYTLSNFNGVSDEARRAVLVVSGTNAAIRDVIAPLVTKAYTIKNNTTGGFAINIRAATGASVSIPNGGTSTVYCDGTNFILAMGSIPNANQALNNFNFTGAVASTSAGGLVEYAQMNTAILDAQNDTAGTFQKQVFTAFTTSGTSSAFTLPVSSLTTAPMATFTGSIAVTTGVLDVSAVTSGVLYTGMALTGTLVVAGTYITGQTSGTTGGVGLYTTNQTTAAASTAMTGYVGIITNQRLRLNFNATGTGTPTLAVSGLVAKNIKQYDDLGVKAAPVIKINMLVDVEYDGTDYVILNPLTPTIPAKSPIQPFTATVAASAMTVTLQPTSIDFRSTTLSSGAVTTVDIATAVTLVIPSGATLGTVNAVASNLAIIAINNAGTVVLGVVNIAGGVDLSESGVITSTIINTASDSSIVIYSTSAQTSKAYRVIGYVESTQATAGTWATTPSLVQGAGGQNLVMGTLGFGQTWQDLTASRAATTTYYNTTGRPIMISIYETSNSPQTITVNGVIVARGQYYTNSSVSGQLSTIVPPSASYVVSNMTNWAELR